MTPLLRAGESIGCSRAQQDFQDLSYSSATQTFSGHLLQHPSSSEQCCRESTTPGCRERYHRGACLCSHPPCAFRRPQLQQYYHPDACMCLQAGSAVRRPQRQAAAVACAAVAPKKVLMMGGTRFIGLYLARQLVEEGHEVTLYTRGKSEITQQIADDTDESYQAFKSCAPSTRIASSSSFNRTGADRWLLHGRALV